MLNKRCIALQRQDEFELEENSKDLNLKLEELKDLPLEEKCLLLEAMN